MSKLQTIKFRLTGVAPLLTHNGCLVDSLNEWTRKIKEISGKRHKTDADREQMAKLEWRGGLYLDDAGRPCVPSYVLEACLIGRSGAAGKVKMRKQGAAGMFIESDSRLEFPGDDFGELDELYPEYLLRAKVKVGQASVMRTRPMFREWALIAEIKFNPNILNAEDIIGWMEVAGEQVGIGDWRPKYGRFAVEFAE